MVRKRKRAKKNISDRSGHFNSLNEVVRPLTGEANKTMSSLILMMMDMLTENLWMQTGLTRGSVNWAFTGSYDSNWFPITWLSHMLDYQLC